jgi:predicted phosphohydrolase
MINIQYSSDLHLDQLTSYNSEELIVPKASILIMGGDICHISKMYRHKAFFQYVSKSFQYVLYIPGNHEFYTEISSIQELEVMAKDFLKGYPNIIYLNNASVFIEDILFTGSCLWCQPVNEPPTWFHIDITADEIKDMYQTSVEYLEKISSIHHPKHIMITHYPPLPLELKKRTGIKSKYNDYYQNSYISLPHPPMIWIFGHVHENVYIKKDSTLYLSNQRKDKRYNPVLTFSV